MPNLALGLSLPIKIQPTRDLLQISFWGRAQSEGSAFTKLNYKHLKKISGRLTRFLLGQDRAKPKEPAIRHLLVVDDEQSICFSMSEYFSQHGFIVDTARELGKAERLIESTDYQVVILDLRLGFTRDNEGLKIIKLIHRRNPETLIVVLTSYGSTEIEAEARRSGADAFLHKPKPLSQVAQVIAGLVGSPRSRAAPHT
jgi:ActR/RegA family two-component response regulator